MPLIHFVKLTTDKCRPELWFLLQRQDELKALFLPPLVHLSRFCLSIVRWSIVTGYDQTGSLLRRNMKMKHDLHYACGSYQIPEHRFTGTVRHRQGRDVTPYLYTYTHLRLHMCMGSMYERTINSSANSSRIRKLYLSQETSAAVIFDHKCSVLSVTRKPK